MTLYPWQNFQGQDTLLYIESVVEETLIHSYLYRKQYRLLMRINRSYRTDKQ